MKKNKLNNFVNERRKQLLNKYSISESKFEKLLLDCGIKFTIKTQRKPMHFSRWMNLVNNFLLAICICRNNIVYL